MSVCVLHPNFGCLIRHCVLFRQNASGVYASGPGPWEVSPASSGMLWIMTEGTTMPRYESDPESQGTEDGEEDGAKELETQLPSITIPSVSNKKPLWGNKVWSVEFDDHHLAAFMYSHLLPETSPLITRCHQKVLNSLYKNDHIGMWITALPTFIIHLSQGQSLIAVNAACWKKSYPAVTSVIPIGHRICKQ